MGKDADWGKAQVDSRAQHQSGDGFTRLGDATNWGRERSFTLARNAADTSAMVRAQCTDGYARAWYLTGSLEISDALYDSTPPSVIWDAQLEIIQGVGQAIVTQRLNLRRLIGLAASVYDPTPTGAARNSWPWVVSGGIFAHAVSVRTIVAYGGPEVLPDETFRIAMALGPIAAGDGV